MVGYYFWDLKAVGGIDFQEFFHNFLGHGKITFAVLFTAAVYALCLVFGRLFCSWGCHIGATQDLAAWVLRKLGWKAPLVRTRFLHWSPFLVLGFVFLWPSLERWLEQGWELQPIKGMASLAGSGPWESLPGWFLSIVTFAACGLGILLFLGTRGFCRFVCPYGALFRLTDLVAPFRVRRTAVCAGSCSGSATPPCTAVCPTAIDVHAETEQWGQVRSIDCVRCNLCIEACPGQALSYSAGRLRPLPVLSGREHLEPTGGDGERDEGGGRDRAGRERNRKERNGTERNRTERNSRPWAPPIPAPFPAPYFLSGLQEVLVFLVALVTFAAADLVYGGHFLAATFALGEGFLAALSLRLLRRQEVSAGGVVLRRQGSLRLGGITVLGLFLVSLVFLYQGAAFKVYRHRGLALGEEARSLDASTGEARRSLLDESTRCLRAALEHFPGRRECRLALISNYQLLRDPRALEEAAVLAGLYPGDLKVLEARRRVLLRFGQVEEAALVDRKIRALEEGK